MWGCLICRCDECLGMSFQFSWDFPKKSASLDGAESGSRMVRSTSRPPIPVMKSEQLVFGEHHYVLARTPLCLRPMVGYPQPRSRTLSASVRCSQHLGMLKSDPAPRLWNLQLLQFQTMGQATPLSLRGTQGDRRNKPRNEPHAMMTLGFQQPAGFNGF